MNINALNTTAMSDAKTSIVIVDDEQSILASLKSLLRRQNYDLHFFDNGFDALDYITYNTPDLIISDMRMPEMTGMEFLDKATIICPTSTRLILSGYEDRTIIFDAIAHGVAQQFIMKPWEDADLLKSIADVNRVRQELQQQHLDQTLQSLSSLTSPPEAQRQIQRILKNEIRSVKELATEIEKIPSLLARVLRIANSVYYSARVSITTATEAVGFIGADYVESLILAMVVYHSTEQKMTQEFADQLEELQRHALHRAILGRLIAQQTPNFKTPALAYTVCLLQDIGFIVRFNTDIEKGKQLVEISKSLHLSLHEAEKKVYTVPHQVVGAALLQLWNFPESIVIPISRHHGDTQGDVLSQIVQIADIVESGDRSLPHDPVVNPLVIQWLNNNKNT